MSFVRNEAPELFAGALNWLTDDFAFVFVNDQIGTVANDETFTRLSDVATYVEVTVLVDTGKAVTDGVLSADNPDNQSFAVVTGPHTPALTVSGFGLLAGTTILTPSTPAVLYNGEVILIEDERLRVLGNFDLASVYVERGYQGTTAVAHVTTTAIDRIQSIPGGWLYHDTGVAGTSELLAWYDRTPANLPLRYFPDGRDVRVRWPTDELGLGFITL